MAVKPTDNNNTTQNGTLRGGTLRGETLRGDGTLRGETLRGSTQRGNGTMRGETLRGGTVRGDGTLRGGTLRGGTNRGVANHNKGTTTTPISGSQGPTLTQIKLKGITYTIEKTVSTSTGEAVIYKVTNSGRTFALKLYYPRVHPESKVVDTLKRISGTGFIVDVIDYGTWTSPEGEERKYELMPYYTGGTLQAGSLHGNADLMKSTALAMLMAIKTSHDHQILHRDIKPGNFMFTDGSHNRLVLTDFGIASYFDTDKAGKMQPLGTRAQFRTKIYAAPEIYTVIDGEIEYNDVKSDYYALGMSLLTLWMGEKPFGAHDERTLLRMKRGESGSLPLPDDMPTELLHMIKGLLVPNPDKRWGFNEFERWLRGENVPVEGTTQTQNTGTSPLKFVWSGSKNQVANTLEELAKLMIEDPALGKRYLYSSKISEALGQAGFPELQIQIDEFINKTYPKNQDAGLMAAAWLLDGDLPFISPDGKRLRTQGEITNDMVNNIQHYTSDLKNRDSLLYVYFRASGLELANKFVPKAQRDPKSAFWQLVFTLNPEAGFPLYSPAVGKIHLCYTVSELLDYFSQHRESIASNDYIKLVYDDAFYMWLSHRDAATAGMIKSKISSEANTRGEAFYYTFYLLGPERNFFSEAKRNENYTVEQIAELVNTDLLQYYVEARLNGTQKSSDNVECCQRVKDFTVFEDTQFYYYLKSKEVYKDKMDYIRYAFDVNSRDNVRKAGPYNTMIATFKAIKALSAGSTFYWFPKSKKFARKVSDLNSIPKSEQLEELRDGQLEAWLAVQYQEDPFANLSVKYTYETLLYKFTMKLGEINPSDNQYKRTQQASALLDGQANKCKRSALQSYGYIGLWLLLVILPLVILSVSALSSEYITLPPVMSLSMGLYSVLSIAISVRIIQIIPFVDKLVRNVLGEDIGENYFAYHKWILSLMYGTVIIGIYYCFANFGPGVGKWALIMTCVLIAAISYIKGIHPNLPPVGKYKDAINPDAEAHYVEPVYYGWKDAKSNKSYASQAIDEQQRFLKINKSNNSNLFWNTVWFILPVLLMVFVYLSVTNRGVDLLQKLEQINLERINNTKATEATGELYFADVKTSLIVRSSADKNSIPLGKLAKGEQFEVLEFEGDFAKIKYGDKVGYVNKKFIGKVRPSSQDTTGTSKAKSKSSAKSKNTTRTKSKQLSDDEQYDESQSLTPRQIIYEEVDHIPSSTNP